MPIDTGIYNALLQRPKSVADYDAENQDFQKNQLNLQTQRQGVTDANALRAATASFGNDQAANYNSLLRTGNIGAATSYQKALMDQKKGQSEVDKNASEIPLNAAKVGEQQSLASMHALDTNIKNHDFHVQELGALTDPSQVPAWMADGVKKGVFTPDQAQQGLQRFQQAAAQPGGFEAWKQQALQGGQSATDTLKQQQAKLIADNSNATSVANNAATNATHVQTTGMTNNTSRLNNRDTIAAENLRSGIGANGQEAEGGLSDEARVAAAARYRIDGTLPTNIGRGAQGARDTRLILNEAAHQSAEAGDTPEASRIAQLANKSSSQALTQLTKQQTMVGAFEKNFTKNADIALELSAKNDRTGIPIVNKWINAGKRTVTGDPDLAAFDASVKATVNEYAKIVSGGSGGGATAQGEIAKVEGLLHAAQTTAQVSSVLNLMKRETANRMQAFEDQKTELTNGMIKPKGAPAKASTLPQGWKIEKVQ